MTFILHPMPRRQAASEEILFSVDGSAWALYSEYTAFVL